MRRILPSSDWDKRKHRDDRNSMYWMPNRMYPVPPWIFILGRIEFLVSTTINGHPLHATLVPTKKGAHRLYVNGGMRAATGVEVGRPTSSWSCMRCVTTRSTSPRTSRRGSRRRGSACTSTRCRPRTAVSWCDPSRMHARRKIVPCVSSAHCAIYVASLPSSRSPPLSISRYGSARSAVTRSSRRT